MSAPCSVKWCDAMATRGDKCAVHYDYPDYDPRVDYERVMSGDGNKPKLRGKPRPRKVVEPVDQRPLIKASEDCAS